MKKYETEKLRQENEALRAQIRDFKRIIEVLRSIWSTLDVDEVLHSILAEAVSLCQADQGSIILFDPVSDRSARTLVRQEQGDGAILDHHLNNLLAGWVLDNNKTLLTDNLAETFGQRLMKHRYRDIFSVLSIPLAQDEKIAGVINLLSLRNEKRFGERESLLMDILTSLCTQIISNAKMHQSLFAETTRLRRELQDKYAFHGIIGSSAKMQSVFALLDRITPTDGRVIIEGESGTGKELIARVLHYNGPRKDGPFVAVDCGALPANLLESELFGHAKGAFTGATRDKRGLFEEADQGTLFLDEITNMPMEVQAKFLRAIQEGEIRPVGSTKVKKIDTRIITAASNDLLAEVESGNFRQDLFYRLNVVRVKLPPLRERREDILKLAQHFLEKWSEKHGKNIKGFTAETVVILESYAWPGNVRELENVVERMTILAEQNTDLISPELLPPELLQATPHKTVIGADQIELQAQNIKTKTASFEKNMLLEKLEKNGWNQSAAAKELGIHESTLRYKMRKFAIVKS